MLAEYGWVAPKGLFHVERLMAKIEDPTCELPQSCARRVPGDDRERSKRSTNGSIFSIARSRSAHARTRLARRLMTIPGIGPDHRDGAGGAGASTGELPQGPRLRRLGGAHAAAALDRRQVEARLDHTDGRANAAAAANPRRERVVLQASRRGAPRGSWLEQMMARKPRMLVTVALANKTARIVWAVLAKGEVYRAPAVA